MARRQATAWTEDVVVKDAKGPVSRRFRFTKTHQGPLVAVRNGKPLAIRLAKLEEGGAIEQSYAMGRAKSVAEFKEAMRPCNLPMFNAIVADTGGNIFYVYNGAVPKTICEVRLDKTGRRLEPRNGVAGLPPF